MSESLRVHDPRPRPVSRAPLAPRAGATALKSVLLFDNGKLDPRFHWEFPIVFDVLRDALEGELGVGRVERLREDLLEATPDRLTDIADQIEALSVDGVVFALLDVGV